MTNDKTNIQITTISPELAKANPKALNTPEVRAINALRKRFYMTSYSSGQVKFYDSLNDNGNQLTMHLIPLVMKVAPELDYGEAKDLVKKAVDNGHIKPLSLETMYYRPDCPPVVNVNDVYSAITGDLVAETKEGDATFVDFLRLAMGVVKKKCST